MQRLARSYPDYVTIARDFEWSRYPDFWRLRDEQNKVRKEHGQYSWKVGAISEVWNEMKELRAAQDVKEAMPVIWIDSGTYLDPDQPDVAEGLARAAIKDGGFLAARSGR